MSELVMIDVHATLERPSALQIDARFSVQGMACMVIPEEKLPQGSSSLHVVGTFTVRDARYAVCVERRMVRGVVPDPVELLTSRELEVAMLVASGQANKEIARRLGISRFTVGAHLARVFAKLSVHNRLQLAAQLMRRIDFTHEEHKC